MKKPHEETWIAKYDEAHGVHLASDNDSLPLFHRYEGRPNKDIDRARLAACAPEMARMLKTEEWQRDRRLREYCTRCAAPRQDDHKPDCPWLALMRKAGVVA